MKSALLINHLRKLIKMLPFLLAITALGVWVLSSVKGFNSASLGIVGFGVFLLVVTVYSYMRLLYKAVNDFEKFSSYFESEESDEELPESP